MAAKVPRKADFKKARATTSLIALLVAMNLAACGANVQQQAQPEQSQSPPVIKVPVVEPDNVDQGILVQATDLTLPYDPLGELEYSEPFSPRAIDDDYIDNRLRKMAIQRWGGQVDAVVSIKTSLNSDQSEVDVTAQAVKVRGDCPFCRRQESSTIAK
jgi:hypothetical protein